jgi:hypothetical protein
LADCWIIGLVDLVGHCIIGLINSLYSSNYWFFSLISFSCISGLVGLISLGNHGIIGLVGLLALLACWLINLVGLIALSTHQLCNCLSIALIVAAAKTTWWLKHVASRGVATAFSSAIKIANRASTSFLFHRLITSHSFICEG